MLSRLKQLYVYCKSQRGLRLIVVAAVLLQVILAIQHFYAHRLLEKDLERDAEREMIMKSVLIKGILKSSETALLTNEWSMQQALHCPNSVLNSDGYLSRLGTLGMRHRLCPYLPLEGETLRTLCAQI